MQVSETRPNAAANDHIVLPTREGYDLWAAIYDEEENPLILLETPEIARLLGDVRGLRIADIGCGTGRHAIAFAAEDAEVTALDFSRGMLDKARAKPGAESVCFIEHDLAKPLPLETEAFDRVTCCLVVDHIADLTGLFREMRRICTEDGFILISSFHPAMMLLGIQARFHDPDTGRDTRPASYTHQIADYVMAALHAELAIDDMSERAIDEQLAAQSPRAAKYLGWPLLLMMRLRKH